MNTIVNDIKQKALSLGFSACGITDCAPIDEKVTEAFDSRLTLHNNTCLPYLNNYKEKRFHPQQLMPEAKSIIIVLVNYHQSNTQKSRYKFAQYALGNDYHTIIKTKLKALQTYIEEIEPKSVNRYFVDSAPVMEKYLATRAGLGWIGKNSLLNTENGSFQFIGSIFTSLALPIDEPFAKNPCKNCHLCMSACPTGAIVEDCHIDTEKCFSYQSIENKGDIDNTFDFSTEYVYGCDLCQNACPYNQHIPSTTWVEMQSNPKIIEKTDADWEELTEEEFLTTFHHSAVKRIGYNKLKNNILYIKNRINNH